MRNISWCHMPLLLWLLLQSILCHPWCTRLFLNFWLWLLGKSKALEGLWQWKLYMEWQVRRFLDQHKGNDNKQVLILAAGYDTLAWRLAAEYPDINFIELDHPATGKAKRFNLDRLQKKRPAKSRTGRTQPDSNSALMNAEARLPPNLYCCHAPIGEQTSLKDVLQKCYSFTRNKQHDVPTRAFQPNIPTAVVVEGLTMYLTQEQNQNNFCELGIWLGAKDP